jgi:FKBP-type peptidyl-prolyl cis-trans isomerase
VVAKLVKESNMSPAEKEARQMMADKKAAEAAEKAYNAASKTPPAPAPTTDRKAKGGVTRADGCVAKGHTKGKMVKMAYGGKAC